MKKKTGGSPEASHKEEVGGGIEGERRWCRVWRSGATFWSCMRARNNRERRREKRKREAKEAGRTFSTAAQGNEIRKKKLKIKYKKTKRRRKKDPPTLSLYYYIT